MRDWPNVVVFNCVIPTKPFSLPSKPSPSGRRCHVVTDEGAEVNTLFPFSNYVIARSDCLCRAVAIPRKGSARQRLFTTNTTVWLSWYNAVPNPSIWGDTPTAPLPRPPTPHGQWHVVGCMDKIRLFFASSQWHKLDKRLLQGTFPGDVSTSQRTTRCYAQHDIIRN